MSDLQFSPRTAFYDLEGQHIPHWNVCLYHLRKITCGTRKTAGKRRVLLPQEIGLYFKMENVVLCLQSLDRIGGKIQTKTSSPQDPPLAMYYAAT